MTTSTAPIPARLRRLLTPSGLRARIVITRDDGTPATAEETAEVRDYVSMLDVLDRRTAKALAAVAKALPASITGGLPSTPAKPRKGTPKRRASK